MQDIVYSLSYVLEHMDLMRNWVDSKCVCNLCCEDCDSVDHFLWNTVRYF